MSASSRVEILEVTSEDDLDTLALILSESLIDIGPFFPAGLSKDHISWRRNQLAKTLETSKKEKSTHLIKAIKSETNEIAGFCQYKFIPESTQQDEPNEFKPEEKLPTGTDEVEWGRFLETMNKLAKKFMGQNAYVSIDLLCVSSRHRGLGTGSHLINHCFESARSERSSIPFFLCATPLAAPLYKRLGFKVLNDPSEDPDLTDEEKTWWPTAMIANPRGTDRL